RLLALGLRPPRLGVLIRRSIGAHFPNMHFCYDFMNLPGERSSGRFLLWRERMVLALRVVNQHKQEYEKINYS
ncbi:MAG: hypothetical protein N2444_07055, partial [Methylocystis sp.]|nr:hypothetical protein [Methylocystis sp.]